MQKILISFIFLFTIQVFATGGDVGNGGDILTCTKSTENIFEGSYVLDYVASYESWTPLISNEDNPLQTIWESLYEKSKVSENFQWMATSLLAFAQSARGQLYRGPDYKNEFIWMSQPFGLIDLKDENLVQIIPKNCMLLQNGVMIPNLVQAVIQENKPTSLILRYDGAAIKQLSPMQFSYLIIHEWLRSTLTNTAELRDVNKLFHSKEFITATAQDGIMMIKNLTGKEAVYAPFKRNIPPIKIQFANDIQNIKPEVLTINRGTNAILNIATFPQIEKAVCLMTSSDQPPTLFTMGFAIDCSSNLILQDGYSLWIAGSNLRDSPTKGPTILKELVRARSEAPDFSMP